MGTTQIGAEGSRAGQEKSKQRNNLHTVQRGISQTQSEQKPDTEEHLLCDSIDKSSREANSSKC